MKPSKTINPKHHFTLKDISPRSSVAFSIEMLVAVALLLGFLCLL